MWMASEHIMARIIPGFLFSGFERPRFDKFGWIQAAVGFFKNGHSRQEWVWVKTLRINQGLFVWGVIAKYPQIMIIIDNPILGNATPQNKPKGLLIQGWHSGDINNQTYTFPWQSIAWSEAISTCSSDIKSDIKHLNELSLAHPKCVHDHHRTFRH